MSLRRHHALALITAALAGLSAACASVPQVSTPYGLVGLVILVLDIWAIVKIVQGSAGTGEKVLWILLIIFFPVIGLILWALLGRK